MTAPFRGFHRAALLVLALAAGFATLQVATAASDTSLAGLPASMADPELARSDYVEHCGGCHGVQGNSAPALVPQLRDRVGYFLCTPEARAYLLRLPNVAHSRITDNQQLADLMNFVIFGLGGASTPKGTKPFTAQELAYERGFALSSASLTRERTRHSEAAIRKCHAPADMRLFWPGAPLQR